DAAELGKQFREAMSALRVSHEEGCCLAGGMAEQEFGQLETGVTGDTDDGDGFGRSHLSKASIFCWRDARVLLLGVMIRTVSSPAMVPAISGNLEASTAAARGCAPLGGVFRTRRFSAGRISRRNSPRARARGNRWAASSGRLEFCL